MMKYTCSSHSWLRERKEFSGKCGQLVDVSDEPAFPWPLNPSSLASRCLLLVAVWSAPLARLHFLKFTTTSSTNVQRQSELASDWSSGSQRYFKATKRLQLLQQSEETHSLHRQSHWAHAHTQISVEDNTAQTMAATLLGVSLLPLYFCWNIFYQELARNVRLVWCYRSYRAHCVAVNLVLWGILPPVVSLYWLITSITSIRQWTDNICTFSVIVCS